MQDIFDIQWFFLWFLFSSQYFLLLWVVIFFAWYYFLLRYYLSGKYNNEIKDQKQTEKIENNNDILTQRLHYLFANITVFSPSIFYREVWIFLRKCMIEEYGDKNISFMTGDEIKRNFPSKYWEIFQEVYLYEFDSSKVDSIEKREKILKNISQKFKKD